MEASKQESSSTTESSGYRLGGVTLRGDPPEFGRYIAHSVPISLEGIDWESIPEHPLPEEVLRIISYMQDVESHTVVFPYTVFSRQAVSDEIVGPFLTCWLYEEIMHGRALAKFLDYAGRPVAGGKKKRTTAMDQVDRAISSLLSRVWKDFLALHMTIGAAHECTTIHAYRRLITMNDHPQLDVLLRRIVQDEARHFSFYMWQAKRRLARPGVARTVRRLMDRFYVPVGVSHQPDELARWVTGALFDGEEGRAAANHVDSTIAKLPGFGDARLFVSWLERKVYN
ncbi:MAG: hypothetical protein JRG86_02270 [Deltaproteobacteria bacterium]|jgi:hypothetical protein|nr:hypothetical protein [Deltaproteobacteria bacterium]MBW2500075.1 hypothetical protein [Deltaproteobacteria bacterium]